VTVARPASTQAVSTVFRIIRVSPGALNHDLKIDAVAANQGGKRYEY
jgi:hypothetical protein